MVQIVLTVVRVALVCVVTNSYFWLDTISQGNASACVLWSDSSVFITFCQIEIATWNEAKTNECCLFCFTFFSLFGIFHWNVTYSLTGQTITIIREKTLSSKNNKYINLLFVDRLKLMVFLRVVVMLNVKNIQQ